MFLINANINYTNVLTQMSKYFHMQSRKYIFTMKTLHFSTILFILLLIYDIKEISCININSLNCKDPSNIEYCVEIDYNRDKLPPNPPLNVSMTLAISVRFTILI